MILPVRPVTRPAVLTGQVNGRLDPAILVTIPGLAGGVPVRLVEPAATGWRALTAAAFAAGHTLKATSTMDSYRPYEVQERTFRQRYQLTPTGNTDTRVWQGQTWYRRDGYAPAAAPGRSNHGWGLAVDTGEERDADTGAESLDAATLTWLVAHELDYGFSHEIQVEPWHIRWYMGDVIPPAVRAFVEGDDMPSANEVAKAVWAYPISSPSLGSGPRPAADWLKDALVLRQQLTPALAEILAAAKDAGDATVVLAPEALAKLEEVHRLLLAAPEATADAVIAEIAS
jgi:hypothetical protein